MIKPQLLLLLSLLFISASYGQEVYYYGINGEVLNHGTNAIMQKELTQKSEKKYVIRTYINSENRWKFIEKEKLRILSKNEIRIQKRGDRSLPEKIYRRIESAEPGLYTFTETDVKNRKLRTGNSSAFLPLQLEGRVHEYHLNGELKSISEYRENQLLSNQNWLPDGSPYIDSIFYSTDREPEYQRGDDHFNAYLMQRISQSGFDFQQIEDQVIIGWVVMETGRIEGVIALKGRSKQLNQYLVDAITELPGSWQPALLHGSPVRYFMSIPLNFQQREASFQEMDISSGMLHYTRY
jgi:hypothetical protein